MNEPANLPKKKFVIFAQIRTGSNLLRNLFNSHPEIYCEGEIFWDASNKIIKKVTYPYLYLNGRSINISHKKMKKYYGCNIKINQIMRYSDYTSFLDTLYQKRWEIVYINRLNIVRQAISELIAVNRDIWIVDREREYSINKTYINCQQLMKRIKLNKHNYDEEQKVLKDVPHLRIVYENELLNSDKHQDTLDKIFNYLGINSVPVKTKLVKTSAENLSDLIENYEEVIETISKTEYKDFLNYS
ncbi:MAG TPA: hypothetical protein V6D28_31675 [Leptolyngbyaceae cyanobacterium]